MRHVSQFLKLLLLMGVQKTIKFDEHLITFLAQLIVNKGKYENDDSNKKKIQQIFISEYQQL